MKLKGLTWDHPRGYAPLIQGAKEYSKANRGIEIQWDRRTLREFGEASIDQYLDRYDLVIVDHPFVGFAAANESLVNFGPLLTEAEKRRFAEDSVGPSWDSYWYAGGLWALPIDAATQVACYRRDLLREFLANAPDTIAEVMDLARAARRKEKFVIVACCPTDVISLFFTLNANLGHPIPEEAEPFVERGVAREVLEHLRRLIAVAHPGSLDWNPIQIFNHMASCSDAIYCPWAYGYSNYSRKGATIPLQFTNAPASGAFGCAGTQLGGTGVAVSAKSPHQDEAVAYAKWLTTKEHQRGTYFSEGGQPASLAAWTDRALDEAAGGFFSSTLPTLETAYVRPRFDGFVPFFEAAGIKINRFLRGEIQGDQLIDWLNEEYAQQRKNGSTRRVSGN